MGQNGGGWVTDMSAEEYRAFAKECMDWARTAKSDRERDIFEQMALTWTKQLNAMSILRNERAAPQGVDNT